jgi:predicted nucleic acid-binding protein
MSQDLIFDASVIIPYLTSASYEELVEGAFRRRRAFISAPVIEELYAGTRSRSDKRDVDNIYTRLRESGRILVPTIEDWANAGIYMARYIRHYGRIEPKDHLADVLTAILTSNHRGVLVTENEDDFRRWQRLFRSAGRGYKMLVVRR